MIVGAAGWRIVFLSLLLCTGNDCLRNGWRTEVVNLSSSQWVSQLDNRVGTSPERLVTACTTMGECFRKIQLFGYL